MIDFITQLEQHPVTSGLILTLLGALGGLSFKRHDIYYAISPFISVAIFCGVIAVLIWNNAVDETRRTLSEFIAIEKGIEAVDAGRNVKLGSVGMFLAATLVLIYLEVLRYWPKIFASAPPPPSEKPGRKPN